MYFSSLFGLCTAQLKIHGGELCVRESIIKLVLHWSEVTHFLDSRTIALGVYQSSENQSLFLAVREQKQPRASHRATNDFANKPQGLRSFFFVKLQWFIVFSCVSVGKTFGSCCHFSEKPFRLFFLRFPFFTKFFTTPCASHDNNRWRSKTHVASD